MYNVLSHHNRKRFNAKKKQKNLVILKIIFKAMTPFLESTY